MLHDQRRVTLAVLVPAALLTAIAMLWMWPPRPHADNPSLDSTQNVTGQVTAVHAVPCPALPADTPDAFVPTVCGDVDVRLASGESITTEIPSGPGAPEVAEGDTVVLLYPPDSLSGYEYQIVDHQRDTALWLIVGAFVLAVIAFRRWRGLSALAGLAVTFAVLLFFIIPAILAGSPPLLVGA